jgi:hypothetical protein
MRVLAPGPVHARPSANPPSKLAEIVTFKHLPQPLRSHIQSFGTLGKVLKFSPFKKSKTQNDPQGVRGVSKVSELILTSF